MIELDLIWVPEVSGSPVETMSKLCERLITQHDKKTRFYRHVELIDIYPGQGLKT